MGKLLSVFTIRINNVKLFVETVDFFTDCFSSPKNDLLAIIYKQGIRCKRKFCVQSIYDFTFLV